MAKKKKRPDYILQNGKVIRSTGASTSPKTDYVLENGKVKKTTSVSAPTKTTTTKKEKKDDILGMDFFQKGSFGDKKGNVVSDTITGVGNTGFDAGLGVVRGALSIVEGGKDLLTYGVAGLSDLVGADKFAKKAKEYAQQDDMEVMFGGIHDKVKNYSLLGDTSRSVTEGLGQVAPIILTGGLGASAGLSTVGTTALTTGVTGISSMGRGMSEAYNKDATDEEAIKYGIISGGIEAGTELLFGGLGKVGHSLGISRGIGSLDDKLAQRLTKKMTNLYAKNFTEFGIKSMAEGTEELIAGVGNAFAKKMTYMKEEDIKQLLQDENLLESFVVGTMTSGLTQSGYIKGMESGSVREANKTGKDFITGYTQNEQAVFDKELENRIKEKEKDGKTLTSKEKSKIYEQVERDIERGEIDTDTIESVLGGETLKKYKSIEEQEASLTKQLEELKQAPNTVGNAKQYETIEKQLNELKQNSNKTQLKEQLSKEVFEMTSNDARLRESYYEKARRGQDFEADLNKYDSKQREVVQKAIDSGILNNTRKTHEFVDFVAKLSVDKGIDFDFSDNERIRQRIRESGFAIGDDTVVNGFKSGNGVTINMQSGKALNTIVGHEITHVLEGTELYDSLASNVKEFAELKGIYQSMYDTAFENYKGVYEGMTEEEYKKAIEKEVTADLIGDYIFSDIDFVRNLSTKNRNVFDKVFNEIKYFLKTVTSGSEAEKQLLKAKKIFEEVYRDGSSNTTESEKVQLSLNHSIDNKVADRLSQGEWSYIKTEVANYKKLNYQYQKSQNGDIIIPVNNKLVYTDANFDSPGISKVIEFDSEYENDIDFAREEIYAVEEGKSSIEDAHEIIRLFTGIKDINQYEVENRENARGYDRRTGRGKSQSDSYHAGFMQDRIRRANEIINSVNNETPSEDGVFFDGKTQFSLSKDSEGRTLSKEQQDYFKDSKIVDKEGNLKVMYHGSPAQFTVFDKKKAKSSGYYGRGFYFSESESHAAQYGSKYEVYLDIKNPIQNGTRNITKEQLRNFISEIAENEDYGIENYGYDATIDSVTDSVWGKDDFAMLMDLNATSIGDMAEAIQLFNRVNGTGYDGIIVPTETVAFYPEQIKNTTNTNPTDNPDVRYSISDNSQDIAPTRNGIYSKDVLKEGIAPIHDHFVDSNNMMEEEMFAPPDENFVVDNDVAPISKEYEAIVPERTKNKPRMVRVKDTTNASQQSPKTKQRRWIDTSTQSDVINQEILPEDLEQAKINYEPIPNKKTLDQANADLDRMGYDKALSVFKAKMETRTLSLSDIALGERLVQESMKRGDRATTGELIQDIAILGTELGQKVQALSIIQRLTPEGQLGMLQKVVNRGKAKGDIAFDGVTITQEMIDKILSVYNKDGTYDQNKLNEAVEDVKKDIAKQMKVTTMDKVNAWRYLSMLGNPKTHIRNLVSNLSMMATSEVKNALSRTIEGASNIENRTRTWEKATDVVKEFAKTSTEEAKGILTDGNSYSEAADIKSKRDIFKTRILQKAYDFNSDLLTKEDWWFKKSAYRRSLEEFLTANGIKTQEDIKKNPKLIEKAKNYAIEQSQIATFQQYSWLANKIGEIERKNVATQIGVGAVLPFKKTPVNIAKTGLAYSPLGFAKTLTYDLHQMKQGKMEASQVIDNLAKSTTGTALTFIGYMLAMSGLLNGGGDDDKEGKYDYQLGEQSYSLNFNGNTYSLNWLTPVAMPLFVGANAYEMWQEGQELTFDTTSQALAQTLDPLSEMSFLSSLDSILTSYESGMGKFAGIGTTAMQSYASQFIPTLSSQVASTIDDTKRSTKVSGDSTFKIGEETLNSLLYKIPFLRETLEPSTDIWGNEVKQNEKLLGRAFESFIAPYSRKENIATKIDQELKDLYAETGDNNVLPNISYNYVNFKGEKYKMSAREHTDFKKTYGTTANDLLEELFATTTYKNSTSDERAELVNNVFDYASEEAKKEYLGKEGVEFTNAKKDGEEYYKENNVKGAIENDMSLDEFKLFNDNPEKYKIMQENNIDFKEYSSLDEDTKEIYDKALNWAKENPEKYKISRVITSNVIEYRDYMKDLDDFRADKDANGKTISGSSKAKKEAYIQSLSLDAGQKMILHRSLFDSKEDKSKYNRAIIEYLDSRDDISYEEMVTILEELDMKVHSDGRVTW